MNAGPEPLEIRGQFFRRRGARPGRRLLAGERFVEPGARDQVGAAVLEQEPADIFVPLQPFRAQ